ncbi:MAG: serine--tRNA ligase [Ignavibacteria bacterium]|nr:serine--tRNA ligase [Bacteroidota bacterium]MSQ45552.1 serine--tRNA ligase [Ignavibacteria bacterium]
MLDIKIIREETEKVRTGIKNKNEVDNLNKILELDESRRKIIQQVEKLKAQRNEVSAKVAHLKNSGENTEEIIKSMNEVKTMILELDDELKVIDHKLQELLLTVPNIPHSSVPIGNSPEENKVIFESQNIPEPKFAIMPHWEIAEKLQLIDFDRGSKVTGAGFPFYIGKMAMFQRALINFFLDSASVNGYTELIPPVVVNEASARGTGQLPDKEDLMYAVQRDGLFLVPTAEVPVSNFHRDEILDEKKLPLKYSAYTPCFRREAGSYGKDVRGLNRLHQFDKVELVKFTLPEKSYDELELLRTDSENLLQQLGLRYRVLLMCTGDMGFTQTKKYDLEVWSCGQKKWLEVSSCSNFEAFQSRRMNIKYRSSETKKMEFVHTLNGSALALPRVVAALMEQYQTVTGKISIPKAIQKYLSFTEIG